MESELFGHKKGSFTGATTDKKGLFEAGHTGTLFLDEIGELSTPIQVKLLRAVQERIIKPVGGMEDIPVDIRIISATNILLPDNLALSIHKKRWIEGVKGRRFDLDEVSKGVSLEDILSEIERAYLQKALETTNDNKSKAAELLGINLRSLRYRLEKLAVDK